MKASGAKPRRALTIAVCACAMMVSGCTYDLPSLNGDDERDTRIEPTSGPATGAVDQIQTGSIKPAGTPGNLTVVQVKTGDSLRSIARDHAIDWRELAAANQLEAPYRISAGQTLMLPAARN